MPLTLDKLLALTEALSPHLRKGRMMPCRTVARSKGDYTCKVSSRVPGTEFVLNTVVVTTIPIVIFFFFLIKSSLIFS